MSTLCFQHDSTVSAFLGALRLFNNIMPPYAASVLVELWQEEEKDNYTVRILYKNDTHATPLVFKGSTASQICSTLIVYHT